MSEVTHPPSRPDRSPDTAEDQSPDTAEDERRPDSPEWSGVSPRHLVLAAGLFVLAALAVGPATAQTIASEPAAIDGCTVVDEPGAYVLTSDLDAGAEGDCLAVSASNVTIDGQGHAVNASEGWSTVNVTHAVANVTVRNLTTNGPGRFYIYGHAVQVHNVHLNDTRLRARDPARDVTVTESTLVDAWLRTTGASDVVVTRNEFLEDGSTLDVDNTHTERNVTIRNNTFIGPSRSAMDFANVVNLTIADNEVDGVDDSPHGVHGTLSSDVTVRDNAFQNTTFGVFVGDSSNVTVAGNRIESSDSDFSTGVLLNSGQNVTVSGNDITDGEDGIKLNGGDDVTLARNTIESPSQAGIRLSVRDRFYTDGTGITIEANDVTGGKRGIDLTGGRDVTLARNTVSDASENGIVAVETDGLSVVGGSVIGASTADLRLNVVTNVTVRDVDLRGSEWGLRAAGAENLSVVGVRSDWHRFDGVYVFDSTNVTVRDTTLANSRFGARVVGTDGAVFENVTAVRNANAGVRVVAQSWKGRGDGAVGTTFRNVTGTGNGDTAIRLVGTQRTTIENVTATDGRFGLWLTNATDTTIRNASAAGNFFGLVAAADSRRVDAELTLEGTTTVTARGTDMLLGSVVSGPPLPSGDDDVDRYLRIRFDRPRANATVSVAYDDGAVPTDVNESDLRLWRYDGFDWSQVTGSTVDAVENLVFGAVDDGGVLAPLGEVAA